MNEQMNEVLDWGDSLESDGSEFVMLPEGVYEFEVTNMERGDFPGSEKMCACPKATLTLKIISDHGTANVFDDLILHKRMEWKLSSFFRAVGLKKKGEKVAMDWNKVVGTRGRAHIIVSKYTTKDGQERETNRVKNYLDYDEKEMSDGFMKIPEGAESTMPFN